MSVSVPFSLRVRFGGCEVEISGSRDEVLKTVTELPNLVASISQAFAQAGVEASSAPGGEIISSPPSSPSASAGAVYPSIESSGNCSDAVLRLLSTDWGKATPRMLPELVEAMRANAVHYPATTLSGVLNWLVRKGRVKRWKTDKGYVYVLSAPSVKAGQTQALAHTEAGVDIASAGGE